MLLCGCDCGQPAPVYNRNRKERGVVKGQVSLYIRGHEPFALRFWTRVNKQGPMHPVLKTRCWLWTGYLNNDGYGQFDMKGKPEMAHRVAFFIALGRWPQPCALHLCDEPSCVRYSHLFEGTKADNNADRAIKGRSANCNGSHNRQAKLTPKQVEEMRCMYASGIPNKELSKHFGVAHSTVSRIVLGKSWKENN